MKATIDQALQKAIKSQKAGQIQMADRLYTAILKVQPRHPDANHNLGVLAVSVGKRHEALPFFKIALEVNPSVAQFWLSYIEALIELGRLADAKAVFSQAKSMNAKGEAFDELAKRLAKAEVDKSSQDTKYANTSNVQDPSQNQLQSIISLYKQGMLGRALEKSKLLVAAFPKSAVLYNIQGVILKGLGQSGLAIKAYKNAIAVKPDYAEAFYNLGNALYEQGKLEKALAQYTRALSNREDYAEAYNNLGLTLKQLGRLDEAIEALDKALAFNNEYADAYNNLGIVLKQKNKMEEALEAFAKTLLIKPDYAEAYFNMGIILSEQGKLNEALEAYKTAIEINHEYADAFNNLGSTLQKQGMLDEALEAYNQALGIKPDNAEAHYNMGNTFQEKGMLDEAIEAYNQALDIKPDNAETLNNIGNAFQKQGMLDDAIKAYKKALAIRSDNAEAFHNLGNAFQEQGKLDEAIEAYNNALTVKPDYAKAHRHLSVLIKYKHNDQHIIQVSHLMKQPGITESDLCNLHYAYAKMNEDLGEVDIAFNHYEAGGALRRKLLAYEFSQDERLFGQIKKTAPQFKHFIVPFTDESKLTPIFILGMPRSGTTLVEQIISSHTEVTGAGELDYVSRFGKKLATGLQTPSVEAVSKFRKRYLSELSKMSNQHTFVTDKMPQNFQNISLICTAFPEAKIVHVKRKAAATCWSNFKHYFSANGLGYSYNLSDTVKYYQLYLDLMNFWQQSYSDRIYNLNYENLTENQELETRCLLEYIGLNWEDACLTPEANKRPVRTASNLQVRNKVYKGSSNSWRKYKQFLDSAFDELT